MELFDVRQMKNLLYPHDMEYLVVLVPYQKKEQSEMLNYLLKSPLLNVWAIAIVLSTFVRIMLQDLYNYKHKIANRTERQWLRVIFSTIGIAFGTSSENRIYGRAERTFILFLSIFALLTGILVSGYLFQQFSFVSYTPKISTLAELYAESNLSVIGPPDVNIWHGNSEQ